MNILVTGASGFIASQIVADLLSAGHHVTCCVRNTAYTKIIFPETTVIACDFIHDTQAADWINRLKNIDVVINCVGIFYHPNKKNIWAIHYETPKALFDACVKTGIKRIIQISALGVDKTDVEYAKSKKAADDYLLTLPITAVILRPSLVYARGSYGGTSLFRGLAGLPWITPITGRGEQQFQPIHLQDLSKAVLTLIDKPLSQSILLSAVSSKRISLKDVLIQLRSWLGFSKAKLLFIPIWFLKLGTMFGNFIPNSTMNKTAIEMLVLNNITSEAETKKFQETIQFKPQDFITGLRHQPSTVQDRWHARLYFLKPVLQISIAFVWIITGLLTLVPATRSQSYELLTHIGIHPALQPLLLYGFSLIDALLGLALLFNYQLKKTLILQLIFTGIYLIFFTWVAPYLWLDHLGSLLKNMPLIAATLVMLALEPER